MSGPAITVTAEKAPEPPVQFFGVAAEVWSFGVTCPHRTVTVRGLIKTCTRTDHATPGDCAEEIEKQLEAAKTMIAREYPKHTDCPCGEAFWARSGPEHQASLALISKH